MLYQLIYAIRGVLKIDIGETLSLIVIALTRGYELLLKRTLTKSVWSSRERKSTFLSGATLLRTY